MLVIVAGFLYWHTSKPRALEVTVHPVELGAVELTAANTRAGTVTACLRSYPTPSVGGQIARIPVAEGQHVKKGQPLLELWNELHKAEVALAESQTQEAESTARATCLQAEVAQREANRLVSLEKRGAASADQTDKAVTEAKAKAAQCAAAKDAVLVGQAQTDVAEARLAQTRLVAPFDGIVAKINGELFEYVTPSPPGIATLPIIDLIGVDCFYVAAPIDEVDAPGIVPGMPARITVGALDSMAFEGRVRRVAPFVQDYEKQARTVDVEVEFAHKEDTKRMLAGYSADIEVILQKNESTLRIPTEAVIDNDKVFVFNPETGRIREKVIEKGLFNWHHTEVVGGLSAEELIVTSVDKAGLADGAFARTQASDR
jgi:HlyD family secretion protein